MKTPEEIAREAAERLVTVTGAVDGDDRPVHRLYVGMVADGHDYQRREWAEDEAEAFRREIAPAIAAAIREALTQCPLPGPVSDERLAEIRGHVSRWLDESRHEPRPSTISGCLAGLVTHIDFLHRILADDVSVAAVREAERRGYERGWAEGAAAQRRADLAVAAPQMAWNLTQPQIDRVEAAVTRAPLATPPGGPTP